MPTISIDGNTFTTESEYIQYLQTTYGANWEAEYASLSQWGCTTTPDVTQGTGLLSVDGVRNFGTIGQAYIDKGWMNPDYSINTDSYYSVLKQYGTATHQELATQLTYNEASYGADTYKVASMPLGSSGSSSGSLPTLNQTATSSNGQTQTMTAVMTEEKIENPLDPGSFSYVGTLAALGWLPLPTWVAAAAPALGVGVGYAIYDLAPEFWEDLSRDLLPFAYNDFDPETYFDVLQMPFALDKDGLIYTSLSALGILRDALIEHGAYATGETTATIEDTTGLDTGVINAMPFPFTTNNLHYTGTYNSGVRNTSDTNLFEATGNGPFYYFLQFSSPNSFIPVICSTNPFTCVRRQWNNYGQYNTNVNIQSQTINGRTVYFGAAGSNMLSTHDISGNPFVSYGYSTGEICYVICYGTHTGVSGIEGTTLEEGATYPTDTTKNLAEIYPGWDANKISVITDPTANTFEDATEDWYPISLSNTNYSNNTDFTSSTQTQQQAQTGNNTDPTQLTQILEGIQNLPDILNRDGLIPDTVPTNPPSTEPTPSPTPPVITGAGSDLISIYNPTKAQIQAFNQFLWDLDPTNILNWQKVIQNPIDAIISLHMIYVTPITGSPQHIKCGYIETDVSSKVVTNQYVDIDCGTVDVNEYFHNVWDYIATDIQIYLPFIGIVPLHVSDIMNSTIRVKYRVDVYTGTCLAQIIVYKEYSFAVLYTFTGNCAVSLPLSGSSFSNIMSTLIVMGGLVLSGNAGTAATYGLGSAARGELKQHIQRSGNIGANAGAMGIRTPYLIITRKKPLDAYLYQEQYGFPANKTVVLGDMNGYTRVKNIHLHGIPCTDDELEMIERLLKDGVIIN